MILKLGSKGEEVKALQSKLGIAADGDFGSGTEKVVKEWQTKNGLTADGIIGPASMEKLGLSASVIKEDVVIPKGGPLNLEKLKGHAPLLTALDIGVMRVRVDKDWIPVVLMGGFAEVENDELTILVNGAEEGSKINKDEAQKELEIMTTRFNEAQTSKEKIEATQNLRKARARVQASSL